MLELRLEDALHQSNAATLVYVLKEEGLTPTTLRRLDKLVTKELSEAGFGNVSLVLKAVGRISEEDLDSLLELGLGTKVLLWFEAMRPLLTSDLYRHSAALLNMTEEFYDYFLLLGQASHQVPLPLLAAVLLHLAHLALETETSFGIRLEAVRTYNSILETLSRERRSKLGEDHKHTHTLGRLAASIVTVGDYELQVSLLEALCRMTPRRDRAKRAGLWFSSLDTIDAFCKIRNADFEVDCRRFLNYVNCSESNRRVYTFPCLRVFLQTTQLFSPKDEKLDAFWIDFNLGSESISFFIDDPQGFLWGSIHLLKQEVETFSLDFKENECGGDETVLTVRLRSPVVHQETKGTTVQMSFGSQHYSLLMEAVGKVFHPAPSVTDATPENEKSPPVVMVTSESQAASRPENPGTESSNQLKNLLYAEETKDFINMEDGHGSVHNSPCTVNRSGRPYSNKKPKAKRQLKLLPLSSASSEDDHSATKSLSLSAGYKDQAEFLFDRIMQSTPKHHKGGPGEAGLLESTMDLEAACGAASSSVAQVILGGERKRVASPTGLDTASQQKKLRPEELLPPLPEWHHGKAMDEEAEFGISDAFKVFSSRLQEYFILCRQKVESQGVESQRHISALLQAVHQRRLLLLQRFQSSVIDQLKQQEEMFKSLDNVERQILDFIRSESQRLASFCRVQQLSLASLEDGEEGKRRNETKERDEKEEELFKKQND